MTRSAYKPSFITPLFLSAQASPRASRTSLRRACGSVHHLFVPRVSPQDAGEAPEAARVRLPLPLVTPSMPRAVESEPAIIHGSDRKGFQVVLAHREINRLRPRALFYQHIEQRLDRLLAPHFRRLGQSFAFEHAVSVVLPTLSSPAPSTPARDGRKAPRPAISRGSRGGRRFTSSAFPPSYAQAGRMASRSVLDAAYG